MSGAATVDVDETPRRDVRASTSHLRNPAVLGLIVALACSGTFLLILQSHLTFFGDDWKFLLDRRGSSPSVFLDPHNDHIAVIPVAIYKALLEVFGMSSALPFQIVGTSAFLLSVVGLFAYLRRCVGDGLALAGSTLILFLGAAWVDLLWSFQVGLFGSIAAGLFALLALQRDDQRGDQVACGLLVVATAFSELGISFAVAALVSVAMAPPPRRGRLYVAIVPLVLYVVWFVGWGHKGPETLTLHNVLVSPKYVFEAISQAIASLLGLATPLGGDGSQPVGLVWGEILFVVLAVIAILRIRRLGRVSRGLATAIALGGSFWVFAAFNAYLEWRLPTNPRYQYPGAVFALLLAAEVLRGYRPDRRVLAAAAVVTTAAVVSGLIYLDKGYDRQKGVTNLVRARLAALEIARPSVAPDTTVNLELLTQFTAGSYFSAVDAFGSPAYTESELVSGSEVQREVADQLMASVTGIRLQAGEGGNPGRDEACVQVPASPSGSRAWPLRPGTYVLTTATEPAGVHLVRFADHPAVDLGQLGAGQPASLGMPSDRSGRPWRLALVGSGPVRVCALPSAG